MLLHIWFVTVGLKPDIPALKEFLVYEGDTQCLLLFLTLIRANVLDTVLNTESDKVPCSLGSRAEWEEHGLLRGSVMGEGIRMSVSGTHLGSRNNLMTYLKVIAIGDENCALTRHWLKTSKIVCNHRILLLTLLGWDSGSSAALLKNEYFWPPLLKTCDLTGPLGFQPVPVVKLLCSSNGQPLP